MKSGLFSAAEFEEAAKGFVLLRLAPGPAEALFGITAAPMAAVADGHGRILVSDLNLRGSVPSACAELARARKAFDPAKASAPPYAPPKWAEAFVREDGAQALGAFLEQAHPRAGGKPSARAPFAELKKIYASLEVDGALIRFCENYFAACLERAPDPGREFKGHEEESALLEEMTYCRNDGVKFKAVDAYARFGPLSNVGFFARRAEEKGKGCRNPNVVLCRCMAGIGAMAARFPGLRDRASARWLQAIREAVPALVKTLDEEARNNGACGEARRSLEAIAEATGDPQTLEAYLRCFEAPGDGGDGMRNLTAKFHEAAAKWLSERTGENFGLDAGRWKAWLAANGKNLAWRAESKQFVADPAAAAAWRKRLAAHLQGK